MAVLASPATKAIYATQWQKGLTVSVYNSNSALYSRHTMQVLVTRITQHLRKPSKKRQRKKELRENKEFRGRKSLRLSLMYSEMRIYYNYETSFYKRKFKEQKWTLSSGELDLAPKFSGILQAS